MNSTYWWAVKWFESLSMFVAIGDGSLFARSTDGINWTTYTPSSLPPRPRIWRKMEWDPINERIVIVADGGTGQNCGYSVDGINWTGVTIGTSSDGWSSLTYCDRLGMFEAGGHSGNASNDRAYSYDGGSTWTIRTSPTGTGNTALAWSEELNLIMGADTTSFSQSTMLGNAGDFVPTISATTNLSSTTAYKLHWSREGRCVEIAGEVDVTVTSSGGGPTTSFALSLPITPAFTATEQAGGQGAYLGGAIAVCAKVGTGTIDFTWAATGTGVTTISFAAMYQIV
jgi:hypothetical protein